MGCSQRILRNQFRDFSCGTADYRSGNVTTVAWLNAVVWVWSLPWEHPYSKVVAKKKKKKKKERNQLIILKISKEKKNQVYILSFLCATSSKLKHECGKFFLVLFIFFEIFIFSIIVDLQCSANFCYTANWPIHMCVCVCVCVYIVTFFF